MPRNNFSSSGIGEDQIRAIQQMCCSELHLITLYQKTIAELENGLIDLDDEVVTEPIALKISHVHDKQFSPDMVNGKTCVAFNTDILQCTEVLLRHWREGDRFKPFGMKGSKLLSDLFTDLKFSEKQKKETWILEADGEILWVIGHRAARAFKVPNDSTSYVIISVD